MAYKDEYEVARLYTDGEFAKELAEQFEGDLRLEFYMAPPALVKPKGGRAAAPKKVRFGPWLLPLLKVLARGKALRGTRVRSVRPHRGAPPRAPPDRRVRGARRRARAAGSAPTTLAVAAAIANVPASIRGYGHVKLASLAIARARESELLNRFDPERYPRPSGPAVAGQFRGIPVTSA